MDNNTNTNNVNNSNNIINNDYNNTKTTTIIIMWLETQEFEYLPGRKFVIDDGHIQCAIYLVL